MSVEASSPLDVHTGVTARSDLFAREYSTGTKKTTGTKPGEPNQGDVFLLILTHNQRYMSVRGGEAVGVVCHRTTNAKTYFDTVVISELLNILAERPWSANFILAVFTSALHGRVTFLLLTANV